MAFNVNDMRAQLVHGGARNTLFKVDVTFPAGISAQAAARKVPFMARAAALPGTELGEIPVAYFGRTIKVAGDRRFGNWQLTCYNDEDFLVRHALESWAYTINTLQGNLALPAAATPNQYKQDATVTQYSRTGQILRVYRFSGLFPVNVAPIQMDWGAVDQIEAFDTTFAYDYFEIVDGTTGTITG